MPRRTPDGPQELTEHSKDSKPYDPELTPVKPKAERIAPPTPQEEVFDLLNERVSTYEDGAVIERLGVNGGTEKWTVNTIDDRGTIFLTSESGKRAMMHESEVALEERAATFAPQLDAAWGKTVDMVADTTDDDDAQETAAFLKSHRGDILFLAAERMAANPDADPAHELFGAVRDTERRVAADAQMTEYNRREREEIAEAKRYVGITPDDAVRLADADNLLGTLRFGPNEPSIVDRGAPYAEHTRTLLPVQLESIAAARATVAELAVLEPDLRDEILGNIPDISNNKRSLADIDAELKKVDDDLSFTEQQWRAHGKGDKESVQAVVYLSVTRNLREREKRLMAERRVTLAPADEVTVPRHTPSPESEEVTLKLPRRRPAPRSRTIGKEEGRGPASKTPVDFITVPPLRDFERDSKRNQEFVKKSRDSVDAIDRKKRLEERLAAIRESAPDTYRPPQTIEPDSFSKRPTTPTRKNRRIAEDEWMKEGESNKDLRTYYEETPKVNPNWYVKFTQDFGGPEEFVSLFNEARARTNIIDFTFENLNSAGAIKRWWYHRKMGKAVKEMVRQDAVRSKKKRGGLQA